MRVIDWGEQAIFKAWRCWWGAKGWCDLSWSNSMSHYSTAQSLRMESGTGNNVTSCWGREHHKNATLCRPIWRDTDVQLSSKILLWFDLIINTSVSLTLRHHLVSVKEKLNKTTMVLLKKESNFLVDFFLLFLFRQRRVWTKWNIETQNAMTGSAPVLHLFWVLHLKRKAVTNLWNLLKTSLRVTENIQLLDDDVQSTVCLGDQQPASEPKQTS